MWYKNLKLKKWISSLLVVILCITNTIPTLASENAKLKYSEYSYEHLCENYETQIQRQEGLLNKFKENGYQNLLKQVSEKSSTNKVIQVMTKVTGNKLKEKDYTEILSNILAVNQQDLMRKVQQHSEFKWIENWETSDILLGDLIHVLVNEEDKVFSVLSETIPDKNVMIDSLNTAKYYEFTIQEYIRKERFFAAILKYSENEKLRSLAEKLTEENKLLLTERLKKTDNAVVDGLAEIPEAADTGNIWYTSALRHELLEFEEGSFLKNYQKMKVVWEIESALNKVGSEMTTASLEDNDFIEQTRKRVDLYKIKDFVHLCGEELLYRVMTAERGFFLNLIFSSFSDREEKEVMDEKYSERIKELSEFTLSLDNISHVYWEIPVMMPKEGVYEYWDGELTYAIKFSDVTESTAQVYLGIWPGPDAPSAEDFMFQYQFGNENYIAEGMRGSGPYTIKITVVDENTVHVSLAGKYFSVDSDFIYDENILNYPVGEETEETVLSQEDIKQQVLDYYNATISEEEGKYAIFDEETVENGEEYIFSLRFQMSDKKAKSIIANGGTPSANILRALVTVNKNTGDVTDTLGGSWKLK